MQTTGMMEEERRELEWRPLRSDRRICLEAIGDGLEFDPGQ